ncbi:hypothetical protein ACFVWN_27515 [Nocardiopsis flavescens]|uniref:Uncharacterized protein n=1 Tax=Nocardiopsis flavescens TaxID=758803 RepID=A0A1M6E0T5_9ACTN|nr:hypothetical protein [Nocardiopsis flavescens]SHI79122.1 hypothetical protein SAMN05421803_102103 [Nocardiopsis flavescens]
MSPPAVPYGHRRARRAIAAAVYVLVVGVTLALAAVLLHEGTEMILLAWEYAARRSP